MLRFADCMRKFFAFMAQDFLSAGLNLTIGLR